MSFRGRLALAFPVKCGWIILLTVAGAAAANATEDSRVAVGTPPYAIQLFMDQAVKDGKIPGAVAMHAAAEKISWIATAGALSAEAPMPDNAIMPLASVGKMFTATAAMILLEQDVMALDDPVSKFIPEFADVAIWVDVEEGVRKLASPESPINIFHLLTHTSGLVVSGNAFWSAWDRHVGITTTTHLARDLARLPLVSQPGEAFSYGQTGASYEVLAAVIEVASGQTLEQFLQDNVFNPLGLEDTSFYVADDQAHRLPATFRMTETGLHLERPAGQDFPRSTFFHGGGGVRSSSADLYRFASLFLHAGEVGGIRILAPETVALMMQDHLADKTPDAWRRRGLSWGFGAAVEFSEEQNGARNLKKYGWVGGGFAKLWVDVQQQSISYLGIPLTPPGDNALLAEFERLMYQTDVKI